MIDCTYELQWYKIVRAWNETISAHIVDNALKTHLLS